jgi:predicted phosphodiesterase
VKFGAVGDIHGDFDALDRIMARHPQVPFWVCPGDLANEAGEYPRPRAPLYWIKGNNEDFDFVAAQPRGGGTLANLHYIPNGSSVRVGGLTLAGLGGTFAPTWYEKPASDLRRLSERDDRRRHFVSEEVRACAGLSGVDVFLTHEAPRPFPLRQARGRGDARKVYRVDAGKTPVNEALAAMHPRLHLFGHHHTYSVGLRQNVPSIGLELASDSYLLVDGKTLAHEYMRT